MVFFPKDQNIRNILERLEKNNATCTDYNTAKQLSRFKQIRELRRKDTLFIGNDHKKNKSIIMSTKPIRRKGNGFLL
jgi:hypothetical protein